MSPTAAIESIAGIQTAKKKFSVPSPSASVMLEKASGLLCLSLPSWKLRGLEFPDFHVLYPDTGQAANMSTSLASPWPPEQRP